MLCVTDVAEGSPDGKTEDKSNSEEDGAVVETSVGLYSVQEDSCVGVMDIDFEADFETSVGDMDSEATLDNNGEDET